MIRIPTAWEIELDDGMSMENDTVGGNFKATSSPNLILLSVVFTIGLYHAKRSYQMSRP